MNVQSLYVKLFDMPCCNGRFAFMQGDDHVNTDSIPYAQVQPSSYTCILQYLSNFMLTFF